MRCTYCGATIRKDSRKSIHPRCVRMANAIAQQILAVDLGAAVEASPPETCTRDHWTCPCRRCVKHRDDVDPFRDEEPEQGALPV